MSSPPPKMPEPDFWRPVTGNAFYEEKQFEDDQPVFVGAVWSEYALGLEAEIEGLKRDAARAIDGLDLHVGSDGVWLCFTSRAGKSVMTQPAGALLASLGGRGIMAAALHEWLSDRQEDYSAALSTPETS